MLNHVGTLRIETDRLVLRPHEMTDADDMFSNWVTDPEVSRFWGWEPHKDISETKALLSDWMKEYEKLNVYHWIIVLKSNLQAVGNIYLADIDDTEESASVHYALSRKYWGQGIITEACKRIMDFAFTVLHAEKIHSHHHVDNPASGKVMTKCGMKYVKTEYRQVPDCEQISGGYVYYVMTADDWFGG